MATAPRRLAGHAGARSARCVEYRVDAPVRAGMAARRRPGTASRAGPTSFPGACPLFTRATRRRRPITSDAGGRREPESGSNARRFSAADRQGQAVFLWQLWHPQPVSGDLNFPPRPLAVHSTTTSFTGRTLARFDYHVNSKSVSFRWALKPHHGARFIEATGYSAPPGTQLGGDRWPAGHGRRC